MSSDITSKNAFVEDRNAANHLDKYAAEKYSKDRRGDRDRGIFQLVFIGTMYYRKNM